MEVERLQAAAARWADNIRTGHLPRELAWQSLQTTILKSLHYPLSATTLSFAEAESIMIKLRLRAHNAGLSHLFTVQGIKHYCKLVKFVPRAESYEQLLLEVGLQPPLFRRPIKPLLKMLTPCWLTHFWELLPLPLGTLHD